MEYFLEPSEFFVGDHVCLYFCLPTEAMYKEFSIDKITQNTSMVINDISSIKINDKNYIKVEFVPWEVGEISFPSLKEIGIYFDFPSIKVSSILAVDKNISMQEARSPLLLPGTTYTIYAYIVSFFILCFLVITFTIWIKKKRISILNTLSKKYSVFVFRFAIKKLGAKLKKRKENIDFEIKKSWVKKYEASLRLFLFSMYNNKGNWDSFTYTEIIETINEANNETLTLIKSIFEKIALIRFGNINDASIDRKIIKDSLQLLELCR